MNSWMAILGNIFTPAKKPASVTMSSYTRNSGKPCAIDGCELPRHISKRGKCFATRCTKHYLGQQARYRARYNARDKP